MAWQDGSAILHTQRTLEETLYQVAPGAEEGYNHSKTHPAWNAQAMGCTIIGNVTDDDGCDNHENAAADAARLAAGQFAVVTVFQVYADFRSRSLCLPKSEPLQ